MLQPLHYILISCHAYTYTPSGAVASLRTYENGEIVSNLEYEYDLRGNQTKKIEDGRTTEYYYYALSRLKTALLPSGIGL